MEFARRQFLTLGAGAVAAAAGASAFGGFGHAAVKAAKARIVTAHELIHPVFEQPLAQAAPAALPLTDIRKASIHNLHTGEMLDTVYWENGKYVPGALAEAMRVMRDWRNGDEHVMDPRLFDLLHAIQSRLEVKTPFQLISGYRSPQTNAMLHAESGQVASKSQHVLGKASDIRVEGVELANLHKAALSLKAGGVGFYPVSNFVHVDVGAVRQWSGT
ncbi:MAG TPA: DUF882 domain-containing protein [Caulobacteraceae bacterium]